MNINETELLASVATRPVDWEAVSAQLDILSGIMAESLLHSELPDVNRGGMVAAGLCLAANFISQDDYASEDDFNAALRRVESVVGEIVKLRVIAMFSPEDFGGIVVIETEPEWPEDFDPRMN